MKLNVTVDVACGCWGLTARPWLAEEPLEEPLDELLEEPPQPATNAAAAIVASHRGRERPRPAPHPSDERGQRLFAAGQNRLAVGEQQPVEVEFEQLRECGAQARLGLLGIVHQPVGHELQRALLIRTHHAVGTDQRPVSGDVQRGLVRADRVDLMRDHTARQRVSKCERRHRATALELVDAGVDAMHLSAESLDDLPAVPVVVPAAEHDVRGSAINLCKPVQTARRQQRIDQHPLVGQVVGTHFPVDPRMGCGPVPEAFVDLLHP